MSQKETAQIDHLTNEQRDNYAKILYVGHNKIEKQEKGGQTELLFVMGKERIRITPDKTFLRAAKGGVLGAYRELRMAGEEDLAKLTLQVARKGRR